MATFTLQANGKTKARIRRLGQPDLSKTFQTKSAAQSWARAIEREMDIGAFVSRADAERTTFGAAADRYDREVLPSKRGATQDRQRLARLVEHFGKYSLASISSSMVAEYRDGRLKAVSTQTTVHELGLISRLFKACAMDWGIALPHGIPTALVRKPKIDNARERRLEAGEEALLLSALRECKSPWPAAAFVLAIETAGRQSELLSLQWREVDLKRRTARLRGREGGQTKSGADYRDVPLSSAAVALLESLPRNLKGGVLPLSQNALQLSYERAVQRGRQLHLHRLLKAQLMANGMSEASADRELRALVYRRRDPLPVTVENLQAIEVHDDTLKNLTFHDLRHEATSRLAEKLAMHELMKVTGHASSRMVSRYYHPRAEDLALKLA